MFDGVGKRFLVTGVDFAAPTPAHTPGPRQDLGPDLPAQESELAAGATIDL